MTRVIAGAARGRRLAVPSGRGTRPTSDRAREALFSTLDSIRGPMAGCRFLDLFAGSGAVGLEAASRGATEVLLVESDPRAARVAEVNARDLGLPGVVLARLTVDRLLSGPPDAGHGPYDVAFADPPYDVGEAAVVDVVRRLDAHGWLSAQALVVLERPSRAGEFPWPVGFVADRFRRYGEGTLWYGRAAGASDRDAGSWAVDE